MKYKSDKKFCYPNDGKCDILYVTKPWNFKKEEDKMKWQNVI